MLRGRWGSAWVDVDVPYTGNTFESEEHNLF